MNAVHWTCSRAACGQRLELYDQVTGYPRIRDASCRVRYEIVMEKMEHESDRINVGPTDGHLT